MLVLTTTLLALFAQAPTLADAHRLDLEGAYNFRDLGGYRTTDGKTIKPGMLYRSEALAQLTDRDYERLANLKIKVLCDFRGDDEIKRAPTKWRSSEIELFPQPISAGGNTNSIMGKLIQGAPPAEMKAIMAGLYGQFATGNAAAYQKLLRRMVDGGLPVLYHCTAGKDRTGVFTAFLMTILGASKETVMEDYLLTNKYVLTDKAIATMAAGLKNYGLTTVPPMESLKPILGVEPEYLNATFEAINKEYGNFDEFRRKALGLTDADVLRLRSMLLN